VEVGEVVAEVAGRAAEVVVVDSVVLEEVVEVEAAPAEVGSRKNSQFPIPKSK
jgi:hypothetical protein